MSSGKFPKPYINDVPMVPGGSVNGIEYVESFSKMGIGARSSGLPANASTGPKGLEHVGGSAQGKK